MSGTPPYRKVLIIENDPDVRNVIYVLLARLECEGEAAYGIPDALTRIIKTRFDAVLLDLKCSEGSTEQVVSQIRDVRPSLVGRVLVITGEVTSPEALKTIEQQCLPQVPRQHLQQRLMPAIKALL